MKNLLSTAAAFLLLSLSTAVAQQAPDPSGLWIRDDGNARVQIAPCGSDICATNVWIGDTSGGEEEGDVLVMKLEPRSATELGGTAYDRKRDRTYSISVDVRDNGLVTRGCVLGGLLCRNVSWTPAQ